MKKLTILVTVILLYSCNKDTIGENPNEIQNLKTNSIYAGEPTDLLRTIISEKPISNKTGKITNSENCVEKEMMEKRTFENFSIFGSETNLIWPGNLIQGESIINGNLGSIPIGNSGRNTIEIKVEAISGHPGKISFAVIESPTPGKVQSKLGEILDSYYQSNSSFPANYIIDIQRTFSSKQLKLALKVGYTAPGFDIGASIGINYDSKKAYYAVTIKQKFFTVSVNPKVGLKGKNGWISEDYPDSEFDKYISPANPATYISTVSYGRLFTLIYESNENSTKIEQALNFAFKNPTAPISVEQKLEYTNTLQNSRVHVRQLGGNASAGLEAGISALAGNFDNIRNFIVKNSEVSKSNPGAIIEYKAFHIDKNLPVTAEIKETSKYQECVDNRYKLIVKNKDYTVLPIIIKTQDKNHGPYYLEPNGKIEFLYNNNLKKFTYKDSPVKQLDLNNGSSSDDIDFDELVSGWIVYRDSYTSRNNLVFSGYFDIKNTRAYTVKDSGINGGPAALLEGTIDEEKNALVLEIKKE